MTVLQCQLVAADGDVESIADVPIYRVAIEDSVVQLYVERGVRIQGKLLSVDDDWSIVDECFR